MGNEEAQKSQYGVVHVFHLKNEVRENISQTKAQTNVPQELPRGAQKGSLWCTVVAAASLVFDDTVYAFRSLLVTPANRVIAHLGTAPTQL